MRDENTSRAIGNTQQAAQASAPQPAQKAPNVSGAPLFGLGSLFNRAGINRVSAAPVAREQSQVALGEKWKPKPPPPPVTSSTPTATPQVVTHNNNTGYSIDGYSPYLGTGITPTGNNASPEEPLANPVKPVGDAVAVGVNPNVGPATVEQSSVPVAPTAVAPVSAVSPTSGVGVLPPDFNGDQEVWNQGVSSLSQPLPTLQQLFGTTAVTDAQLNGAITQLTDWVNQYNWPADVQQALMGRILQTQDAWQQARTASAPTPPTGPAPVYDRYPRDF